MPRPCLYCGHAASQVDHIHPHSRGGTPMKDVKALETAVATFRGLVRHWVTSFRAVMHWDN